MKKFRLLNNIFGWIAFLVAAVTYLSTIEPTGSFWDCGEFVSSAYKLNVGHPPGAPFFMLMGKFFSLFASGPAQVAMMVNAFSALCSAFTILFLFWTITHLARKVVVKSEEEYTLGNIIGILGAGMVGALAYTFSDTFWFSAVEGEVYAFSSLFTAVVFWLILKWERVHDRPGADRWLILIAYMMGLSIGVHLLNLLAIPAIVMVYYFKKYTPTWKGGALAMLAAIVILGFTQYGLIPGFTTVAAKFELFFVNTVGMPFNSGMFIYLALMVLAIVWSIYESTADKSYFRMTFSFVLAVVLVGIPFIGESVLIGVLVTGVMVAFFYFAKKKVSARWLNTIMMMITVMLMGYSSYAVIMIRSSANPTMDQNSPDNVFALKYYLNREQYGDRPLLYGETFNAPPKVVQDENGQYAYDLVKKKMYAPKPKTDPNEKDKYVVTGYKMSIRKNDKFMVLFPRMYSDEPMHISGYKMWGEVKGSPVSYEIAGEEKTEMRPTFIENLRFFVDYQVVFMYWRYFMWNFSGRQNDIQGNGEIEHGNWITGINLIDNLLVGDQSNLPTELKNNKGRNTYFLLPFLLGVLGIFFLLNTNKKGTESFWITLLLFLMTGLAIVLYLNQPPYQPRERDYAYAGSFYAFSIWIGLGVLGIIQLIKKYLPSTIGPALVTIACLGVPVLMAAQNWDDHDRSGRYTMRDFGQNYLNSCEPNSIIFSNGDNDTFPLWYNQEVEGVRTDVRVCNLSYLQTDWYIDQMKRGAYKSAPLPITWKEEDYVEGKNDVVSAEDALNGKSLSMDDAFTFLLSKDPSTKIDGEGIFLSRKLFLPINKDEVLKSNTVSNLQKDSIVSQMDIDLESRVTKSSIMMLEMLRSNHWKRPMYVAMTVGDEYFPKSISNYVERTGLANHIVPVKNRNAEDANVNVDQMYNNVMTKFKFGGIENPKVYIDENIMRMCHTHRMIFADLVEALLNKGDTERAKKALLYCEKVIPATTVPHNDYISTLLGRYYYALGMYNEGSKILDSVAKTNVEYLNWYAALSRSQQEMSGRSIGQNMAILQEVLQVADKAHQKALFDKYYKSFERYATYFNMTAR